jgi:DMSO reductase anchor subunit
MIAFLFKSAIAMAVLIGVYYLLLQREKMYGFNRFYLLGALIFSLILPLVTIPIYVEIPQVAEKLQEVVTSPATTATIITSDTTVGMANGTSTVNYHPPFGVCTLPLH